MTRRATHAVTAALVAGVGTAIALRALERQPPGGRQRWRRTNFAGRDVDLLAGPAAAVGAATATLLAGDRASIRRRPAAAVVAAAALGLYDDLAGETHARGLRGHFAALREGRITTGMVKLVGLAAAGVIASEGTAAKTHPGAAVEALRDGALISGTANLVNLLDLRPGRALKAVSVVAVPVLGTPAAPAAAGALATAGVLLPGDLGEQHMIGDCGANALGALVGWGLVTGTRGRTRTAALLGVVVLTLLSEKVSFSAVIDRTPLLAAVDGWGRLPA